MNSTSEKEVARNPWVVLFVSLFAFMAFAFAFQVVPPLIPSIMDEFGVSNAEVALMMSIVLIPGIFLGLPAGAFVDKYGARRVGVSALLVVALGSLIAAVANSFILALIGRLILGIGGAFVIVSTPAIIAQWFEREKLGRAMGIFSINMPLATVIALPTSDALRLAYGWHFPFYISLCVAVAAAVFFAILIRTGPFAKHEAKTSVRGAIFNFEIWKVGLVWLFFNAAALSFVTWGPTLFKSFRGMNDIYASFLASVLMLMAIFSVPVFGYLLDRTHRRKRFAVLGSVLMAVALVAAAFSSDLALVASIVVLGIAAGMVPPIASVLPPEILGPVLAGVGFGITGICLNVGAAVGQPLIGYFLDVTGSYAASLLGIAVFSVLGAVVAFTLRTR
jgi:MFS family permease